MRTRQRFYGWQEAWNKSWQKLYKKLAIFNCHGDCNLLEDTSKLDRVGKYGGARIYIPSDIVKDSQFPIELGKDVEIKIDVEKKVLIISPKEE